MRKYRNVILVTARVNLHRLLATEMIIDAMLKGGNLSGEGLPEVPVAYYHLIGGLAVNDY